MSLLVIGGLRRRPNQKGQARIILMTKQQEAKPPRRHNRQNKGVGNMMPNAENNSSLADSFITFFHYFTALPLQDLTSNGRSISATTGSVD